MKIGSIQIKTLQADEGKVLTNGEIYSKLIYLGTQDNEENWNEIAEEDVPESLSII